MPTINKRTNVFDTYEGTQIEDMLHAMETDVSYNTENSYAADGVKYPGNTITFFQKHREYIIAHPAIDPRSYMSNLRLKTKLR